MHDKPDQEIPRSDPVAAWAGFDREESGTCGRAGSSSGEGEGGMVVGGPDNRRRSDFARVACTMPPS
jgi:hypothetical protein